MARSGVLHGRRLLVGGVFYLIYLVLVGLVIGGVFLAIVLFSPDGLLGLWAKLRTRFGPTAALRP